MVSFSVNISGTSSQISGKALEEKYGKMETSFTVSTRMEEGMELEGYSLLMEMSIKESSRMAKEMALEWSDFHGV